MTMTLQSRNPFHKSNPFFVPQKFYSQEHISSYPFRNNLCSPLHQNYLENHQPLKHSSYAQIQRYQQIPLNQTTVKDQKLATLKKRNIRDMENPFFRKNLLPTADDTLPIGGVLTANMSVNELQLKHERLFYSRKKERESEAQAQEKEINDVSLKIPSIKQLPSVKQFTEEQSEKKKYLSSEFALKLKSNTYLENSKALILSKCDTNQIPISLGKQQSRIPEAQDASFPQTIVVAGKIYYSQNMVSNF